MTEPPVPGRVPTGTGPLDRVAARCTLTGPGVDPALAVPVALTAAVVLSPLPARPSGLLTIGVLAVLLAVCWLRAVGRVRAEPLTASTLAAATLVRSAAVLVVLCGWSDAAVAGRGGIDAARSALVRVDPARADLVWAGLAAVVLAAAIAAEEFLLRLLRLPVPFVHGLPGVNAPPDLTRLAPVVGIASGLATLVGAVLATARAPGWAWAVVAGLSLVPAAIVLAQTRRRRRAGAIALRRTPGALAAYAPEFVLFTARPDDAAYQVTMWLPYLKRTGRRFVVLTRTAFPAERLARLPALEGVPVVCCRTLLDLEAALVPSVRAAFYVNASSGNGALTRYGQLEHVYLGHGDSDKPPSYNPTHAMFDLIFAAGPAAVRRYAEHGVRIAAEKFRVVGRPQVEAVTPRRPSLGAAGPVVLYAPTWRGHVSETALSSLDRGERIVGALLDRGATVIFRPHPFSYDYPDDVATVGRIQARLAADAAVTGRGHLWGPAAETDRTAFDCMNASDAMVSDVSSVVSDYLFSDKPYAMVAPSGRSGSELADFARAYPVARAGYLVDAGLETLPDALGAMLGDDPLAGARAALRVDCLGPAAATPGSGGQYAETFVAAVRDVIDHPGRHDHEVAESDDGSVRIGRDTIRRHLAGLVRTVAGLVTGILALTAALVAAVLAGPRAPTAGEPTVIGPSAVGLTSALAAVATVALVLTGLLPALHRARRRATDRPEPWPDRPSDRLTVLDAPRVALMLTLAVGLVNGLPPSVASSSASATGPVVAGVLLVLLLPAVASERPAADRLSAEGVRAVGLPELRVPVVSRTRQVLAPLVGTTALAVIGLLSRAIPPVLDPLVLIAALPAAGAGLLLAAAAGRSARQAVAAEQRLPEALAGRELGFCVYFGAAIGVDYQLGMWLPWFDAIGRSYLIVCRTPVVLAEIGSMLSARGPSAPAVPVLLRESFGSIESVITPSMTTAFYVNNAVRNTHLIERRELSHVWLNHGDSEKPACFNSVHAIYDLIFAAGQAGVDRYARHGVDIPAEKFVIVGRPQVSVIERGGTPVPDERGPVVLYAPTWQGPYADSRVFSLPLGRRIVEALLARGATVVFRPHPFNQRFADCRAMIDEIGAMLAADGARSGRPHRWGAAAAHDWSVEDCFNASDAMVCDVSAVVSDYLQSGKPFSVVAIGRTREELLAEVPAAAASYLLDEELTELEPVLDGLLTHPFGADPLAAARDSMRRYYLGDFGFGADYAEAFLGEARAVVAGRTPAVEAR